MFNSTFVAGDLLTVKSLGLSFLVCVFFYPLPVVIEYRK